MNNQQSKNALAFLYTADVQKIIRDQWSMVF